MAGFPTGWVFEWIQYEKESGSSFIFQSLLAVILCFGFGCKQDKQQEGKPAPSSRVQVTSHAEAVKEANLETEAVARAEEQVAVKAQAKESPAATEEQRVVETVPIEITREYTPLESIAEIQSFEAASRSVESVAIEAPKESIPQIRAVESEESYPRSISRSLPKSAPIKFKSKDVEPATDKLPVKIYRLFFATTREAIKPGSSDPDKHPRYYTREWNKGALTYGTCQVTVPTEQELPVGETEAKIFGFRLKPNRMRDVWMHEPKTFPGAEGFFQRLEKHIATNESRTVLIGVHGYNNTFEFAGRRLVKMMHDMNYSGIPILYSWPAGDGANDYGHDEQRVTEDLEQDNFTEFLEALTDRARRAGAREIHVIAHSMGNRLLKHAVREIAKRKPAIKPFDAVVMAAPDVARDGFAEDVWPKLQAIAGRCALYVSRHDKAVFGSAVVHRDGPRLGQWEESEKENPFVAKGLETVDAGRAGLTFLHHDYYIRNEGIRDIAAFLIDGLRADQRTVKGWLKKVTDKEWFELVPLP